MLYNNNYGNGFSYPAPNNGVNYNNVVQLLICVEKVYI